MSTPAQRATLAQDEMRQCIVDQSTAAISARPALLGEIYRVRTPQQIDLLLTQLKIDIDLPISASIKSYIIEYGSEYLTPTHGSSPASSAAILLDGLSMAYFPPNVRAAAKGFTPDSEA
jgi:hypothetical protein